MIDLNYAFSIIFPDRIDSKTGRQKCRWCGKPVVPKGRSRRLYCNDEHYNNCVRALSWELVRQLVFKRDKGICQMCGEKVYLYGAGGEIEDELKWYKPEYHIQYRQYFQGIRKAEIHHIIPCEKLQSIAYQVTKEIENDELRRYWDYKLTVMLVLDINNLTTLCQKPCHDIVHSSAFNKARKAKLNHRLLTDFQVENIHLNAVKSEGS